MDIVFNIETAGLPKDEILHLMPEFSAPSNYKDEEKIQAWKVKKQEEWFLDASSSALSGKILAIAIQEPFKNASFFADENEKNLLQAFWDYYRNHCTCRFVGFGCNSFAIPFLVRRSWVNRVAVPNIFRGRFLNGNFTDLMQVWGCGTSERTTLANLAKFFGLKYEPIATPLEAMWRISRKTALKEMERDVLAIRYIGEVMGVVAEEDFQWE